MKYLLAMLVVLSSQCFAGEPLAMTPLHDAVHRGRTDDAIELIKEGSPVDAENLYGVTPLSIACQGGHHAIVESLLDAGADPNKTIAGNETPLMIASRTGDAEVVKSLIKHGAMINATQKNDQTALMWAAAEGNTAAVEALVEAGADVNLRTKQGFTAMLFAAREGRLETVQRLAKLGAKIDDVMEPENTSGRNPRRGTSALMLAVESGHFELAIWLVEHGADPNDQRSGYTPLHAVTWVRKTDRGDNVEGDPSPRGSGDVTSLQFVRKLVGAGADVNARLENGSGGKAILNRKGATAFLMAGKTADLPLLKLLLELGADPQITNVDDCNALMAAAGIGVVAVGEEAGTEPEVMAVVEWLIDQGLDPNHVDGNGETAMHGAAYRNYPLVVEQLAALGANPNVWNRKNKHGWTPELIAAGNRPGSFKPSPETITALRQALSDDARAAQ